MMLGNRYKVRTAFEGGMGIAYVCEDTLQDGKLCVLKTFKGDPADRKVRKAFAAEAQAWIKLRGHQFMVSVDDIFVLDARIYLRMPFCKRGSLRMLLEREGALDVSRAVIAAAQIALAMRYLGDQQGLLHLDLKPENILLSDEGHALVSDLGLARPVLRGHGIFRGGTIDGQRATSASVVGTVPYMAPEMILGGQDVDVRADIWAYGVLVYEMVVGMPAFGGVDLQDIARAVVTKAPAQWAQFITRVPKAIASVIGKCIEKDRNVRFPSFHAMCEALDACLLTGDGDSKQPFWRRETRIKLDDVGTCYLWASDIGTRDRKAFDVVYKYTEFMLYEQGKQLRGIGKTREALGVLEQLFGQFDQPGARMADLWGPRSNKTYNMRSEGTKVIASMGWPVLVEAYEFYLACVLELYYDRHPMKDSEKARHGALFGYLGKHGYPSPKITELHAQWLIQCDRLDEAADVLKIAIDTADARSRVSSYVCKMLLYKLREDYANLANFLKGTVLPNCADLDEFAAQEACARGYQMIQRFEDALRYYARSLELNPNNPWSLKQACLCAWNLGRQGEAGKWRKKLVRIAPDSYHLADVDKLLPALKASSAPGT